MSYGGELDVSRETLARLKAYEALIRKWTAKINLVSRASLPDLWIAYHGLSSSICWQQHFQHWADLGSGGGLPGIVVAIRAKEQNPDAEISLVESDQRKAVFLRTVIRELDLKAQVHTNRIEVLPPLNADIVSAGRSQT